MPKYDEADPYDLLRRAREIIERNKHRSENTEWLADFKKLPGAKLTTKAVKVLRDANLRCLYNTEITNDLLGNGYLMEVRQMRGHGTHITHFTQIRLNKKGREALRLREDVK